MRFNNLTRWFAEHAFMLTFVTAGLMVVFYVTLAGFSFGFPLDDGWIHHTYARNFAQTGRWEYVPGVISAGSTAPLWTLWLAVGYVLHVPYWLWTFVSGWLCIGWVGIAGISLHRTHFPQQASHSWLVGILIVTTWQLVWASASGMETMLFTALAMTMLWRLGNGDWGIKSNVHSPSSNLISLGFLSGLLMLTRPDGLVLIFLTLVFLATVRVGVKKIAIYGISTLVTLIPYFYLNYISSGTLLPNTFYAKQAEYTFLLAEALPVRFIRLLYFGLGGPESGWQGMSGAHWMLLVGWINAGIYTLRTDLQNRQLRHTLPLLWAGGHLFLYAWRLPVTYQHGRYLLPSLPIWVLYGTAGWLLLLAHPRLQTLAPSTQRLGRLALSLMLAFIWGFFALLGANQYATDVAFIDGEMVAVAQWLNDNTPPDALIASHDIGAIGYFARRPILDLAGLISPEIISVFSDEALVADYLLNSDADYLVTAPGWTYESVVNAGNLQPIYTTNFAWTQETGSNNMTVYPFK